MCYLLFRRKTMKINYSHWSRHIGDTSVQPIPALHKFMGRAEPIFLVVMVGYNAKVDALNFC